jgi:hypothetical protein
MKALLLLSVLLTLTGCKEILATYKNVTDQWCSYVTDEQVKEEKDQVMALFKDGTDKAEAERIINKIGVTSEHACETLKALRAMRALKAVEAQSDK